MAWIVGALKASVSLNFEISFDPSRSAQHEVACPAKPAKRPVAQGDKPVPEQGEPGQLQQLRFDDPKQPLDDKEARRISADDYDGAGEPMFLPRNSHRSKLQWLDEARRDRKHQQ